MPSELKIACCVASLLCFLISGCGGKPATPKPAVAGGGPAPVAVPQVNPPAANGAALPAAADSPNAVPGNAQAAGAGDAGAAEEPAAVSPDEFDIDTAETVLEVAGQYREPPAPTFDVAALPTGQNSSSFEIVDPEAANSAPGNTAANAAYTSPYSPMPPRPIPGTPQNPGTTTAQTESSSWHLPEGATPVPGVGVDPETGLPLRITLEKDPVEMVLIPPGVFLEGADGHDPSVGPQHPVLLETPYYIDVVEVTVARHNAFREFYRKTEGRKMDTAANHDGNPEAPAGGIKYLDAKFYAKWTGKELPTEAQWERAARGAQGYDYPWGNGRPIWHQARLPGQLDPVGTHPGDRSPFGVLDMAGNVREWCLDLYSPDEFQRQVAQGGSPVRNPAGPKTFQGTKLQVVKGGKTDWTVWQRAGVAQSEIAPDIGFRCVLNIAEASEETEKSAKPKPADNSATKGPATKGVEKKGADKKKKNVAF